MDHIFTFCGGFIAGIFALSWMMADISKKKDFMMIDGKMKWVERTERFRDELEKLKQSRIKDMK